MVGVCHKPRCGNSVRARPLSISHCIDNLLRSRLHSWASLLSNNRMWWPSADCAKLWVAIISWSQHLIKVTPSTGYLITHYASCSIRTWLPQVHQMLFCCIKLILRIDTMEMTKSHCCCQIKSFKKVRGSFYLLTWEPNSLWTFVCKSKLPQPPQSFQMLSHSSWLPSDGSETFSQPMLCCFWPDCV